MSYSPIGLGTADNDGLGDSAKAGGTKINSNFLEIYNFLGDGSNLNAANARTELGVYSEEQVDAGLAEKAARTTDIGATSRGAVSGLKLHKAIADVRAGNRSSFRILTFGDSLSGTSWSTVQNQLARLLAPWLSDTPVYANSIGALEAGIGADLVVSRGAQSVAPRNNTGSYVLKTDYDVSFDGSNVTLGTGEAVTFSEGGNSVWADSLLIPIVTEPGAGVVKIEILSAATPPDLGDVGWRNPTVGEVEVGPALTGLELLVDADAALGATVIRLDVELAQWNIKISHSSGPAVRVLLPMHEVRNAPAINIWRASRQASNDFTSALASSADVQSAIISEYNPDIIVVESDDRLAAYQNFLPILSDTITAAALANDPLVLLITNPFYDNAPYGDADIRERSEYCWDYIRDKVGWDVLDGLAIAGGLGEASAAGWSSDGIHYSGDIAWTITRLWGISRGYAKPPAEKVGGDAERTDLITVSSEKPVTSKGLRAALLAPTVYDTAAMEWGYAATGSASSNRNAASILLATGSTANSTISAYINQDRTPMGLDQGNLSADQTGFGTTVRITSSVSPNHEVYITARGAAWNSGYIGALTASGYGFRIQNGIVEGICWYSGAQVVSSGSYALTTGGAGDYVQLVALLDTRTLNNSTGTVEWFVNGESLGSSYSTFLNLRAPRVELTNGADATNRNIEFLPPRVGQSAAF